MKISLFKENGALNSKPIFDAFEHSLHDKNYQVVYNDINADIAVIWSVLWHGRMLKNKIVYEHFRKQNKNVIVLEVGGIKRGETWKVGLNGINRKNFCYSNLPNTNRNIKLNLQIHPWRQNGEFILLCGQHDKSLQWQNLPTMSTWFMKIIERIQSVSNRPIIIRPHPRCKLDSVETQYKNVYRQNPLHLKGSYDSFDLQFERIWATVSYNSNPGPQSILAGIPAFVGHDSIAYPVANDIDFLHDIETPLMPDRQQWLNEYAWTEFTLDEIYKGLPLERLTNMF